MQTNTYICRYMYVYTVGESRIESKRAIKYLGVVIDDRLNFKEHVKYVGEGHL